jgi:superfamily II RNA helicase
MDKNLWSQLVNHLKKIDLLPVVVFTFSKKRCEANAASLSAVDLNVASEKSEVHVTVEKALTRLKGSLAGCCSCTQLTSLLFQDRTRSCRKLHECGNSLCEVSVSTTEDFFPLSKK